MHEVIRGLSVLKKLFNILLDKSSLFICFNLFKSLIDLLHSGSAKSSKLTIGTNNVTGVSFVVANFK